MQRPSIARRLASMATGMLKAPKPELVPTPDIMPEDSRPTEGHHRGGPMKVHKGRAERQARKAERQRAAYMARRNGKTWKSRGHG